jgi:hypothetical protein
MTTEESIAAHDVVNDAANGQAYAQSAESAANADDNDIDAGEIPREFSLKSFKCFAREHPLLLGFGAAGIGAAFATLGAGYVLYRGAQRTLPGRMLRLAKVLVTF